MPDRDAKSISHETTFATDIGDPDALRCWLLELTEQVAQRLRRHKLRGRTVQIKVRFADFRTITRSQTLSEPTSTTDELWQVASDLLETRVPFERQPVRLLGMGVSDLHRTGEVQQTLFDSESREQQSRIDEVSDVVRDRFGSKGLRRGATLDRDLRGEKPGDG